MKVGAAALLLAIAAAERPLDYDAMAAHIAGALRLEEGERVLIRFDPGYFQELVAPLRRRIRAARAIDLDPLEYAGSRPRTGRQPLEQARRLASFAKLLETVDVYLWLPLRAAEREIPEPERGALARWLDRGGARREIHFHWSAGSVEPDGLAAEHPPGFDLLYGRALAIDYGRLTAVQKRAEAELRRGSVRVRTPAGTDLRFTIGDRPFNRQDGDASRRRMALAKVRVDREIELPAGVVRVAPLEESVQGRIVIPEARFGGVRARGIDLAIERGRVTSVEASENLRAVEAALEAGGSAARRFREFGLGFNPKLERPAGGRVLPYYGYGAGVVRLSLGDNRELGGAVAGDFVRWFFFPDATVEVEGRVLVRDGRLDASLR
jgi:hypothetical protein